MDARIPSLDPDVSKRTPGSCLLREREAEQYPGGGDSHVLFAVDGVTHGRRRDLVARLEMPQGFAGSGVERNEVTLARSHEEDTAGGRQDARRQRILGQAILPLDLAG